MSNDEIAAAIADVESRAKSNTHRLDKMEKRQDNLDKLVTAVAGVQKDLEHTQQDVGEIKSNVKAMMDAPRKHWDAAVVAIITGVVSALIGAVMALVLK